MARLREEKKHFPSRQLSLHMWKWANPEASHPSPCSKGLHQATPSKPFFRRIFSKVLIETIASVIAILYQRDHIEAFQGLGLIPFVRFRKDVSYQTPAQGHCVCEKIITQ